MWEFTTSISLAPNPWRGCMDRYKISGYIWYSSGFFNTYVDLPAYSPVYKTTDWWFSNHWTFLQNLPQGNNVFVNLALLWLHSPAADCLSLSHGLAVWEPPPWGTGCETWFPHWGKEKKRWFCLVCCGLGLLTSQEHTNLSFLFSPLSCSVYSGYLWSFYATLCWHMVPKTGKEYREILSKKSRWQLDFAQYLWLVAPATFFCLFPETMIVLIKYILERICACYCSVSAFTALRAMCHFWFVFHFVVCALVVLSPDFGAVDFLPSWAWSCWLELEDKAESNPPSSS